MFRKLGVIMVLTLLIFASTANCAYAWTYWRLRAVTYAGAWWSVRNPNYPSFDSDCANFTSQCMHVYGGDLPNDFDGTNQWYYVWGLSGIGYYTTTWTVARLQRSFLLVEPRASSYASASSLALADMVYYDWQGDGIIDHVAIVTRLATSTSPGPRVTAHTSDRYNVYWDLKAYGAPATTKYYFVHIYDSGTA